MSNANFEDPASEEELIRWRMRVADRFLHYREGIQWRRRLRSERNYGNRQIPQPAERAPDIYLPIMGQHAIVPYEHFNSGGVKFRIDDILGENQLEGRQDRVAAFRNLTRLKNYFASLPDAERFRYRRCLGWGGNGLAAAFDVLNDFGQKIRSIVVKTLFSDNLDFMDEEIQARMFASDLFLLAKFPCPIHAKCEHIVQLLYTDGGGLIDENGNRITGSPAGQGDVPGRDANGNRVRPPTTLILEMLENGDLHDFIIKVREHNEDIPNRVLWSFFLCLSRMCVGMGYPCSIFDELKDVPGPITELPATIETAPLPIVHFDFDPKNVFIGEIRGGVGDEHEIAPLLKLGDFGLASEVLADQDDFYYERLRSLAKPCFFAPEQFCTDWDYIDYAAGDQVNGHRIAGNYDAHTNVWGVGLIMECLITKCYPRIPPTPQETYALPPLGVEKYWTYGAHLLADEYSHVDQDLRHLIMRCQANFPDERPLLQQLADTCFRKLSQDYMAESDEEVLEWLHKIMHEPPDIDVAAPEREPSTGEEEQPEGDGPGAQVGQKPPVQFKDPTFFPRGIRLMLNKRQRDAARAAAVARGGGPPPALEPRVPTGVFDHEHGFLGVGRGPPAGDLGAVPPSPFEPVAPNPSPAAGAGFGAGYVAEVGGRYIPIARVATGPGRGPGPIRRKKTGWARYAHPYGRPRGNRRRSD